MSDSNEVMSHTHHRARMRDRLEKNGVFAFKDHEILEMILFYSQPRQNTNETGHELLREFGDLCGVFSALPDELKRVKGVGKVSADLINMLSGLFERISSNLVKNIPLNTRDKAGMYAAMIMGCAPVGSVLAVYLNKNGLSIEEDWLSRGKDKSGDANSASVVNRAAELRAEGIIIIHNHKNKPASPSPDDFALNDRFCESANAAGIKQIIQIIVSDEGYTFI